jgi:hypothetical protein
MEKTDFDHFHLESTLKGPHDADEEPTWTEEEETAVRRKFDFHVVPLVTLLYLLCFVRRTLSA